MGSALHGTSPITYMLDGAVDTFSFQHVPTKINLVEIIFQMQNVQWRFHLIS